VVYLAASFLPAFPATAKLLSNRPRFGCTFFASAVPATHVVVIGASAGGIGALRTLLSDFPKDIKAAILVVVHTSPEGPGLLGTVLGRSTSLTVVTPHDATPIRNGYVYVAPPDYHLVVESERVHLSHGPREHRFRPAIDPLFRSAVDHFRANTIGVVLSGHMADGTHGLSRIKQAGGTTIVQDPDEAEVPAMPLNAMRQVAVDYVLPVEEMARVIMGLLTNHRRAPESQPARSKKLEKPRAEAPAPDALRTHELNGPLTPFTCPDCGGTLWEIKEGDLTRYRCHVGHGFTGDSLRVGMDDKIEDTLWSALRIIEEAIELRTRMMARANEQRLTAFAGALDAEIGELKRRADAFREVLLNPRPIAGAPAKRPPNRKAHG
jgi:two-component system, chemotaxis family, protein-glutamate methylesterase/glutaminase